MSDTETTSKGWPVPVDPGYGRIYGAKESPSFITHDGYPVWMWRKGQRIRFYDHNGEQHGKECRNVAPAVMYAHWCGWEDPTAPQWLNDGCRGEARRNIRWVKP